VAKLYKYSRFLRHQRRIRKALEGKHSQVIEIHESLSGSAADAWRTFREAAAGLPYGDLDFLVLLMLRAGRKVRAELREMERE